MNAWLRSGAGGLLTGKNGRTTTGIIDRAAVVEVQNGSSGVFQAGFTNDGTHPTQAVHTSTLAPLVQAVFGNFALPA